MTEPVQLRDFSDTTATRHAVIDRVKSAFEKNPLILGKMYDVKLSNIEIPYTRYTLADQKKHLLEGRDLVLPIRGRVELIDKLSGKTVEKTNKVLAHLPYLTPRGTMIAGGNEYAVVNQYRLKSGVYNRVRENGELESQFNVIPGTGMGFRLTMEPTSGVFQMQLGNSSRALYPWLKAVGVDDATLEKSWGSDILTANKAVKDPRALNNIYERVLGERPDRNLSDQEKAHAVYDAFQTSKLDSEVTKATLGTAYDKIEKSTIIDATKRILNINRGTEEPDDRDSIRFRTFHGVEDFLSEKVEKDAGRMRRLLMQKVEKKKSLKGMPAGFFTPQLRALLQGDARALPLEEINPVDLLDQQQRAIALGEGGIPSIQSVPMEARNVHSSQFGIIDPIRGPESNKIGVDVRLAYNAFKGPNKSIYTQVRNIKTGKLDHVTADTMALSNVAFPGEMAKGNARVKVMNKGHMETAARGDVEYELPSASGMFALSSNLVPMVNSVSGNRLLMAGKAFAQTLPLVNGEAPLVQSKMPGEDRSFENLIGHKIAAHVARFDGEVVTVDADQIVVRDAKGKEHIQDIYENFPFNRQTFIHAKNVKVKVGDKVKAGDLLATTNFADKAGTLAIGRNLRVGYIPYKGYGSDDGIVVSESAAKKLTSEHLYGKDLTPDKNTLLGLNRYISFFPTAYSREQTAILDDQGVIKPGTMVKPGDPIILGLQKKTLSTTDLMLGKLHKNLQDAYEDVSVTWDHDYDGKIIDVVKTNKGIKVNVKTEAPVKVADKLCYDNQTEVLTAEGWIKWSVASMSTKFATLNPTTHELEYQCPQQLITQTYSGLMYKIETQQVDLVVTPSHDMYVACGDPRRVKNQEWKKVKAVDVFGEFVRYKKDVDTWRGFTPSIVVIPGITVVAGQGGRGNRDTGSLLFNSQDWAEFFGYYLADGNCFWHEPSGSYGVEITKKKEGIVKEKIAACLKRLGLHYVYTKNYKFRIYSKPLATFLRPLGKAWKKYVPREYLGWASSELQILLDAMIACDGHVSPKGVMQYQTTSKQLADDVSEICLKIGLSGNVLNKGITPANGHYIEAKHIMYKVGIVRTKNTPSVNHSQTESQKTQVEAWINYSGMIFCATVPNGLLYVRRNGKPVWSGNSGRYGNKGVVSLILPDDQMPTAEDGRPLEIMLNPLGIISRINPAQVFEAALGKVARKTGQPVLVEGFGATSNLKMTQDLLAKHGLKDTETLTDPMTGRKIPNVLTGESFMLKISKTAKSGFGARTIGPYTSEELPAKGGVEGAKRVGNLELNALLSHGAIENIRDMYLVKGQKNTDFWRALRLGYPLPSPKIPFIYNKFENSLRASGINVKKLPNASQLLPMTDRDTEQLSKGTIDNALMFRRRDFNPEKGGLFDEAVTGGPRGERWGHIALAEPIPNPVMEEPVMRILGITEKKMRDIIAHRDTIDGKGGGEALVSALTKINPVEALASQNRLIDSGKRTGRDNAVKVKGYFETLQKNGIRPEELMIRKLPVIPPMFRPVTFRGEEAPIKSAVNQLYADVIHVNRQLIDLKPDLPDESLGAEKLGLYDAAKAISGLGDPVSPQGKQKELKGFLEDIVGSSPKTGMFQFKLLGKPQDVTGRAVIVPDPTLGMDEIGLPQEMAWSMYQPFVMRKLVQRGLPAVQASDEIEARTPRAKAVLDEVLLERPVLANRAPTLHKFNILALKPRLRLDKSLALPPLIEAGFNADHDGDAFSVHVPVTEAARTEALEKMLPSKNLFALGQPRPMHMPVQESHYGLFQASSTNDKKEVRKFPSKQAALDAYRRNEIDVDDPIEFPG